MYAQRNFFFWSLELKELNVQQSDIANILWLFYGLLLMHKIVCKDHSVKLHYIQESHNVKQRRTNVDATSWPCIDVDSTLF